MTVRGRLFRRAKSRSLRLTVLIVLAFVVCWTPYEVVLVLNLLPNLVVDERYTMWIFFFGMANSLINPLIYGACHFTKQTPRQNVQYRFVCTLGSSKRLHVSIFVFIFEYFTTGYMVVCQKMYSLSYTTLNQRY